MTRSSPSNGSGSRCRRPTDGVDLDPCRREKGLMKCPLRLVLVLGALSCSSTAPPARPDAGEEPEPTEIPPDAARPPVTTKDAATTGGSGGAGGAVQADAGAAAEDVGAATG